MLLALAATACDGHPRPDEPPDAAPACAEPEAPLPTPELRTPRWAFEP
jgi:hypothetical protein